MFGGGPTAWTRLNTTWTLALDGGGGWRRLDAFGALPLLLDRPVGVFDNAHRRLFVTGLVPGDSVQHFWVLTLRGAPRWSELIVSGGPSQRHDPALGYDPLRDRLLLHGGRDSVYGDPGRDDLWALSLGGRMKWKPLDVAGTGTGGRYSHSLLYDARRDRMIVGPSSEWQMDQPILALDLKGTPAWNEVAPWEYGGQRAVLDSGADELLLVDWTGTTLALSLADGTWRTLAAHGPPCGFHPFGRQMFDFALALDSAGRRLLTYGGASDHGQFGFSWADMFALPLAGGCWDSYGPYVPGSRMDGVAFVDPVADRLIIYGGRSLEGPDLLAVCELSTPETWAPVVPGDPAPVLAGGNAVAVDPLHSRLLVFGGPGSAELWELPFGGAPVWRKIESEGPGPGVRVGATALYDVNRDRLLIFGGDDGSVRLRSVWEARISGASAIWTRLVPDGILPFDYGQPFAESTGEAAWVFLPWTSAPPYDGKDRLVRLSLRDPADFSVSSTIGDSPIPYLHLLGFDSRRMRFVGAHRWCSDDPRFCLSVARFDSLWFLPVAEPEWITLPTAGVPPAARYLEAAVYDPRGDRIIVHAGYDDVDEYFGDTWALEFPSAPFGRGPVTHANVSAPAAPALALEGARPNPALHGLTIAFTLPNASPARLEVVDLAGRRVASREVGSLGAGRHVLDLTEGASFRSGVYWLRLCQGGRTLTAKVAVLR